MTSNLTLAADVSTDAQNLGLPPESSFSALIEQSSYPAQQSVAGKDIQIDSTKIKDFSTLQKNGTTANRANGILAPSATAAVASIYQFNASINTTYGFTLNSTYPEIYAFFSVTSATKITSFLTQMATTNSNVDIFLYRKIPGTSSYTPIYQSSMPGASNEQLSALAASAGDYMLSIVSVGTVAGGSVQFGNYTSSGADSNEPDDNFWSAKSSAATFGVSGNLDNSRDVDVSVFTLSAAESINYRIIGGNYHAVLYSSTTLAPVLTLPNNTIGRVAVPAGTYYWGVKSPTGSFGSAVPYTFSAYRKINNVTFNFVSDEGVVGRVDWGAGKNFAFKSTATISGYAYDANNMPARGAALRLTILGSTGVTSIAYATTNAQGYYSAGISSPNGAGAKMFNGACNFYYYDIHNVVIQNDFGSTVENISSIKLIEGATQTTITGTQVPLNDVAYYVYKGC